MDFGALMQQYSAEKSIAESPQQSAAAEEAEQQPPQQQDRHSQPLQKHRGGRRLRRQPWRPEGSVEALGGGEYKLVQLYGKYKLWEDEWFCEPDDLIVTFEAKADNDITVAITAEKDVSTKNMYEIVIGGWKNTKSVVRTEAQGQERAVAFDARLCNGDTFLTYWVALQDGQVAAGVGETPGQNLIIAWTNPQYDPDDIQPCWLSFTSWDNTIHLRNVRTSRASLHDGEWREMCGPAESWKQKYVPSYIEAFEAERAENLARAQRFGVEFVAPDPSRALSKLSHEQRELARASQAGRLRQGFATGFDVSNPEEVAAREARAARFGIEGAAAPAPVLQTPLLPSPEDLELKRARAERFGEPLVEQVRLVDAATKLSIKPRQPSPEESQRPNALHLFGDFRGISTSHILRAFNDFNPTHVEWLHDNGCNICFADEFTAKRATEALTREIPPPVALPSEKATTSTIQEIETELNSLIQSQWRMGALLDNQKQTRYILVRYATSGDVKEYKPKGEVIESHNKRSRWAPSDE